MNQDVFMEASQAFSDCTAWRSRGYIPHFDRSSMVQSVTFRLADAVPEKLISQWKLELKWKPELSASISCNVALRKRIEKYEDAGYGKCWLRDVRIRGNRIALMKQIGYCDAVADSGFRNILIDLSEIRIILPMPLNM